MRIDELDLKESVANFYIDSGITELYPPQIDAIKLGLLSGKNIVSAVPTASGKTMIAELAMLNSIFEGGKAVYIVPLRALASEKYERFLEFESLGLKVGISTGDFDLRDERLASNDIIVVTSEKMDSLLRNEISWAQRLTVIVADEIHLLDSGNRGPTLEITLAKLRRANPKAQILALSATVGNAHDIAGWLGAELIKSDWRPVKLREGVFLDGVIHFDCNTKKTPPHKDAATSLILDTISEGGQCLIFESTRRYAEKTAQRISKALKKHIDHTEACTLSEIAVEIKGASETDTSKTLADCVECGIAFHHAGLLSEHRRIVEEKFKENIIKVICSTPTLAAGINLPARRVIVRNYRRYEVNLGSVPIPVLEYKQMCGRAGRPNMDPYGESVLIAKSQDEFEWLKENYIFGRMENITSKLGTENALRTHLLSLISSGVTKKRSELMDFLKETFYAFLQDPNNLEWVVENTLNFLKEEEMIVEDEILYATELGRIVSKLYIDPLSAAIIKKGLITSEQIPDLGLVHLICKTPDMRLLYLKSGDYAWINDFVYENHDEFTLVPSEFSSEYEWFLSEVKTAVLIHDWICEKPEEEITKKLGVGPGDIRSITDIAEWLMHSTTQLSYFFHLKSTLKAKELRARISYGATKELLDLLRIRGVGRVRARKLYNAGYKNVRSIRNSDVNKIKRIVGAKTAEKIIEGAKKIEVDEDEKLNELTKYFEGFA